jgi:hypothetical protein
MKAWGQSARDASATHLTRLPALERIYHHCPAAPHGPVLDIGAGAHPWKTKLSVVGTRGSTGSARAGMITASASSTRLRNIVRRGCC